MATKDQQSDSATDSTETDEQDNTATDQSTADETSSEETQDSQSQEQQDNESASSDTTQQDGKKDPAKAALLADLHKERKDRQTAQARVAELEGKESELTSTKETLEAVQAKYDRLEGFLQAAGGPLGRALDSRSFTRDLFETDKDIADIVTEWNKNNPSATSAALGSTAAAPDGKKPSMNELLRTAAKQ